MDAIQKAIKNKIYTWQNYPVKSSFVAMEKDHPDYSEHENAKAIARLFMYSLPGNTLDVLLDSIANDLISVYKDNPDYMLQSYDVQNRIRGTLERLCGQMWGDK